jgi:hypothetical protein
MKIVYPYQRTVDNFELIHSVRLLKSNHSNVDIYIVGDNPRIEGTTHVPFKQTSDIRGVNVTAKMLHFAEEYGGNFIYMNDDFFVKDNFMFDRVLHGEQLEFNKRWSAGYNKSVINTLQLLKGNGFNYVNFERHQPVPFNSDKLLYLFKQIKNDSHHFLKSIYHNVYYGDYNYLLADNLKLNEYKPSAAMNYMNIYGAFSTGEGFLIREGREFIKRLI